MPRTLAQNAQYIAETIKPAIKTAIEAQGVTVPSTDSFLDYADRIGEIEGGGSGYQLKDLPTGSISTVTDAAELPLNALKVSVEAWQEGSGDPSPSNIRPIHGRSTATITDKDDLQNPTQTETWTHAFTDSQGNPLTCYGAEWDVVGGGLGNQYGFAEYDGSADEGWTMSYGLMFLNLGAAYEVGNINIKCNELKPIPNTSMWTNITKGTITITSNNRLIVNHNTDISHEETLADFKAWLANNPLQVMYKLATPTTISQQPLTPRMLEGVNNLYVDCGEVIEGEYFVDEGAHRYQLYDYIESDGTQVIDLGVNLNANDVVKCMYVPLSGMANWDWLWIAEDTNTSKFSGVVFMSSSQMADYDYSAESNRRSWAANQISESSLTASAAINANVKFSDGAIVKLYSLSINNNYFLPCKRKADGVFGLYDVANKAFLTDSANGNAFVGGNPIGVEV